MILLAAIWFFLPAGLANAAPVFAALLPGFRKLNAPLDMGKQYRGKRVFGANKTWRGLVAGMVVATLVIAVQKYFFTHAAWAFDLSWFDYDHAAVWLLGPLFGGGALIADAIESFFKRQRDIPPGDAWIPFDQTDYIIGGCLFSLTVVHLPLSQYAWVLITWFGLHLLAVYVGHMIGLREKPI